MGEEGAARRHPQVGRILLGVCPKWRPLPFPYWSVGGRKEDYAEHPMVIPMDLPSSHQEPRGPMTRARARALKNEVTSFHSDITYDPLETWLLPKSDMLCMIRCQEEPPKDAREDGQAAKSMDEEERRKEKKAAPGPGHPALSPDIRPLETSAIAAYQLPSIYRPRTSGPSPDIRPGPEIRPQRPDIRTSCKQRTEENPRQPGHPAPALDIRLLSKARTSGPTPRRPAPSVYAQ